MKRLCVCAIAVVLLGALSPPAQQSEPPDSPFLVLSSHETAKLQGQLSAAAAAGYQVLLGVPTPEFRNILLLGKRPVSESVDSVVLGVSRIPTLQKELNQAADEGYRLLPQSVFVTDEWVGVMEKRSGVTERYEYVVVDAMSEKGFEKDLNQAAIDGYSLCWVSDSRAQHSAVLERPATSAPGTPPTKAEAPDRFLWLSVKKSEDFSQEFARVIAQGYRLALAGRQIQHLGALLEKATASVPGTEYAVLRLSDDRNRGKLEESLNAYAARGFRLRLPVSVYSSSGSVKIQPMDLVLFLEKKPDTVVRFQYRTVYLRSAFFEITPESSQTLSEALQQGYALVDGVKADFLQLLVLEKRTEG